MNLIKMILPATCVLCDNPTHRHIDLCCDCERELPWQEATTDLTTPIIAPFHYAPPLTQMIGHLKFHHQLVYARILGQLLGDFIKNNYCEKPLPQLIIPVPLHHKRLSERGFNQALEIARELKKLLSIPLDKHSVIRTRHTQAQSLLHAKERKKNLQHAFKITKPIHATHVAIVDDVITTGNTARALIETLTHAGIEQIDVWCCCKAS